MYLWDTNILRHFGDHHPVLDQHIAQISWQEIALPSIVLAEALRGRCEFALKATPEQAPFANQQLFKTYRSLLRFNILVFDEPSAKELVDLKRKVKGRKKRHADIMIAAMAIAGGHVVVTRNLRHFADLLPARQLANWIDHPPT